MELFVVTLYECVCQEPSRPFVFATLEDAEKAVLEFAQPAVFGLVWEEPAQNCWYTTWRDFDNDDSLGYDYTATIVRYADFSTKVDF